MKTEASQKLGESKFDITVKYLRWIKKDIDNKLEIFWLSVKLILTVR